MVLGIHSTNRHWDFYLYGDKVTVISVYYFFQICVYTGSHAFCFGNYLV